VYYTKRINPSQDLSLPVDHPMEEQRHDQVVFQNVADQYVKGEDVAAFFTISKDITVNPDEDQIGLLRVYILFQIFLFFKNNFNCFVIGWLYKYQRMFSICRCTI
jgi:hypothetical protein